MRASLSATVGCHGPDIPPSPGEERTTVQAVDGAPLNTEATPAASRIRRWARLGTQVRLGPARDEVVVLDRARDSLERPGHRRLALPRGVALLDDRLLDAVGRVVDGGKRLAGLLDRRHSTPNAAGVR